MTDPLTDEQTTDSTPLCPVCGMGVVDDLETTAAGADVHGECLSEAAMLAAIAAANEHIGRLTVRVESLRQDLGSAEGRAGAQGALAIERRMKVEARDRRIAELNAELSDIRDIALGADADYGPTTVEAVRHMGGEIDHLRDRVAELETVAADRGFLDALGDDDVQQRIADVAAEVVSKLFVAVGIDAKVDCPARIAELEAELVAVRSDLDAVNAAILDAARMPMLAVLLGSEENAQRLVDRIDAIGAPASEPEGWIVAAVDQDGTVDLDWGELIYRDRVDAEAELTHDRESWRNDEFRLYEVREVRS